MERYSLETHTRHTQNMWRLHFGPVQNSMNIFTEIRIPPAIFQWRQDSLFPRSRSFARMLATIFYLTPRLEQMTISLICLGRTIMLCQRNTGSAELGRTREDTNAGSLRCSLFFIFAGWAMSQITHEKLQMDGEV
jgi:hypothetical protein